jgi:hypothetical protein
MTASYETASNAVVATVGFYAGALADLAETIHRLEKKVAELELQRNQLAIANAKLAEEDRASRRVVDVARSYCELVSPIDSPEDNVELAALALLTAIGQYDAGR